MKTFIDICAGIGGFRTGLERVGFKCIGYIEHDKFARKSYEAMYDTEGEYTEWDLKDVQSDDIPYADIWCFGFPCQDISVAGRQKGIDGGERSSIFYTIIKLIKSKSTEDRPEWLLIENVRNLLSINGGKDFTRVLTEISEAGYDAEWHTINSKDYGVPQNRERVFIIGHLRERGGGQVFPIARAGEQTDREESEIDTKQIIHGQQAYRVYDSDGLAVTQKAEGGGVGAKTGLYTVPKIESLVKGPPYQNYVQHFSGLARTLTARDYKDSQRIAIPVLTPDRVNKRQNGRRFKNNGEPMFTLTTQDKHGVLIYKDQEHYIRRLTPRECFRLQGFSDEQFNKAREVNSDSQLYKQAGNAVTTNVIEMIGSYL